MILVEYIRKDDSKLRILRDKVLLSPGKRGMYSFRIQLCQQNSDVWGTIGKVYRSYIYYGPQKLMSAYKKYIKTLSITDKTTNELKIKISKK